MIFAFIILGLFMLLVAARDVFVGGKGSILLRCYCVSCHLSGFEVGLDIYLCDKSLENKCLCVAKVNMSGRYLIVCDDDWAIVIADIPVENAFVILGKIVIVVAGRVMSTVLGVMTRAAAVGARVVSV